MVSMEGKYYLFHRPGCGRRKLVAWQLSHLEKAEIQSLFQKKISMMFSLTPWCSAGPSLLSLSQDMSPVLFLLGLVPAAAAGGSFDDEIPDSASPPFDFLLHAFAAWISPSFPKACSLSWCCRHDICQSTFSKILQFSREKGCKLQHFGL